ncbi:MAG: 16S rRNA (guanine(966)-N(2))-methyltransferase RsmD [Oscillospiraceae bacterium]|nr:16S rRNA (guanine(966)-N(2))-methyltransferase RsmD [Oscillospiraceae bacterium]
MRITSGSARGRQLKSVPGSETRPTSDMVKQAIFNILQFQLADRRVLDLFAGTGQLGLEALSRGAAEAVFVDRSPAALAVIRSNAETTGLAGRARIVNSDYKAFLRGVPPKSFDLVLLDPPYREKFVPHVLKVLESFDILSDCGIIICEVSAGEHLPQELGRLRLEKLRRYGGTALALYRPAQGVDAEA